MQFLLDTQIYLWLASSNARLSARTRGLLLAADSSIYVSTASLWEIAIKVRIGKLKANLDELVDDLAPSGYQVVPVLPVHTIQVSRLPLLHGDPFDRMLIAQAMSEQMWLITADAQLPQYSELVIRV